MTDVSRRAFRIAYDGRPFHGFQRQPDVGTVSDAILDALRALDVLGDADDVPPGYAAAGRTDAGVSALAQTVAFDCPEWLTPAALNSELPADVRAWASADAFADFHATHHAVAREYTYHLHAPDASLSRATEALDALDGEHDFHNFTPDETGTVRDLSGDIHRDSDFLVVTLRADGFPRQFVRRAVTVVDAVASGAAGLDRIDRLLGGDPVEGPGGLAPATPEALVLTAVEYPGLAFERDESALASAREIFETKAIDHRTNARVASTIAGGIDR
ncbi:tRNA pseudouridine synthase A protein [Halorhabdus tiamatea SARL4B]|uniref:tRNA pseudouridine synthase A n=1 Tax=Halorhabdus tiamatea SARL4B TaxID=1033806 RepID=F7PNG3_9EURY|nr:tRNA pseudouridine(38-40) synthase TruA [Halorhabdus tiamatea]ERJ06238.1 tRNA pseudouridine synthase A protein [Halorhabdus tiamatea SARL4B]CCQ33798.1 tRNA pseudouridine synthase A [Halorhabdus tiamatea SARL4B]